jgi:hypothetical protein
LVNKKFLYQKIEAKSFLLKEFPTAIHMNEDSIISGKNRAILKVIQSDINNLLLNANISVDNQQYYLQEINTFVEGEEYGGNQSAINYNNNTNNQMRTIQDDNINLENIQKIDFKKCFYKQPSQIALGRKEGNLSLSSEIDKGMVN